MQILYGCGSLIKMNYQNWQWALLVLIIVPSIYADLKKREINFWLVAAGIPAGILLNVFKIGITPLSEYFVRFLPGIAILLAGILLKGSIGLGDGIICIFLGSILTFEETVSSIIYGFIIAAVFGIYLLMTKKVTKKYKLPFVPFLAMGVMICGIM